MGITELLDQLNKASAPGWFAAIAVVSAYVLSDVLRRRDARKADRPTDSGAALADNALYQRLINELSDGKRREDRCSEEIRTVKEANARLTLRVETLERIVAEKDAQISSLFKLMRHRAQPGGSTDSEDSLDDMRQWMVDAFTEDEFEIVAADAHLTRPGRGLSPEKIAQGLIDEAKRRGMLPELEEIILAKRPSVKPW